MKKLAAVLVALMMLLSCTALADGVTTLVMETNAAFPPYEYVENDTIVGIDAEIAAKIAEKLGLELDIINTDFDAIIPDVATGKCDIGMAGMTVTDERLQNVNFSVTYATGIQVVIVKEDSAIASVDDVLAEGAAYVVGVQQATTGDIYISGDLEATPDRVQKFKTGPDAVEALKTGKVDCVIIDIEPAKAFVAANEGLKILQSEYTVEDYAIAVALENTELLDKINTALEELIADGTVQAILDAYISAE